MSHSGPGQRPPTPHVLTEHFLVSLNSISLALAGRPLTQKETAKKILFSKRKRAISASFVSSREKCLEKCQRNLTVRPTSFVRIVVPGQMMSGQRSGHGRSAVRSVGQAQGVGRRRGSRIPRPATGLAVEHPQFVVDGLCGSGGRLLLLLGRQVAQHAVNRRHLHVKHFSILSFEILIFYKLILHRSIELNIIYNFGIELIVIRRSVRPQIHENGGCG